MSDDDDLCLSEACECPICGGEGYTFECFDGCCAEADFGCEDCLRVCECQKRKP